MSLQTALCSHRTLDHRSLDLKHNIERQIVQRTWGRIHRLAVEATDNRVIVHGYTPSYYIKQLALEGALEALGSCDLAEVELDIHVGSDPLTRLPRRLPD